MSHVGGCSIPGLSTCSVALYCSLLYLEVPSGSRLADLANSTLFIFHLTLFTAARERASLNPHLRYTDTRVKATRIPLPPSQGAASLVQCLETHLTVQPCPQVSSLSILVTLALMVLLTGKVSLMCFSLEKLLLLIQNTQRCYF